MYISTSSKRKLAYYFHTSCNELFSWKLKTSFCFVCSLGCPTKTCFFEEENKLAKPRSYASLKLCPLNHLITDLLTSVAKNPHWTVKVAWMAFSYGHTCQRNSGSHLCSYPPLQAASLFSSTSCRTNPTDEWVWTVLTSDIQTQKKWMKKLNVPMVFAFEILGFLWITGFQYHRSRS